MGKNKVDKSLRGPIGSKERLYQPGSTSDSMRSEHSCLAVDVWLCFGVRCFLFFPRSSFGKGGGGPRVWPQGLHSQVPAVCFQPHNRDQLFLLRAHFCVPRRKEKEEVSKRKAKHSPSSPRTWSHGHTWPRGGQEFQLTHCCSTHNQAVTRDHEAWLPRRENTSTAREERKKNTNQASGKISQT